MKSPLFLLLLSLMIPSPSSSTTFYTLSKGSSLRVEKSNDVIASSNGLFSAGFYSVGDNAYCFSIWYTKTDSTIVWMANRDRPINGIGSTLSLLQDGNIVLIDAGRYNVWTTNTPSDSPNRLQLMDTGNLVLKTPNNVILWQSFDHPTDTLLPQQQLTRDTKLVSSKSRGNYSSGFYSLYFDNDNILRMLFNGAEISSIYWPDPSADKWDLGRTTYNSSRVASFDSLGHFQSSDGTEFFASDLGIGGQRRLTLDSDGNLRLYSLDEKEGMWKVSWQAIQKQCKTHGLCGPNSLCVYEPDRKCSCLPGFKVRDPTDWSYGCEPRISLTCDANDMKLVELPNVDFYGYDIKLYYNVTLDDCQTKCLQMCTCKAVMYRTDDGMYNCFAKSELLNGLRAPDFLGTLYLKLPKDDIQFNNEPTREFHLNCSSEARVELPIVYEEQRDNKYLKHLLWFAIIMGVVEMICIFIGWYYLFSTKNNNSSIIPEGYLFAASGFKKFTYAELKKATRGFREEIGRGGGGVVYKGVLRDGRVAAVKKLNESKQEEGEFLAEVSIIGRINHMNLIEMWGFCSEAKHSLLVYEYMEHGSLAENLSSDTLDWEKRFDIALGTAKGLAYLHEECLEWVLHCDVKPQNILLDENYEPKVADFGLSKLLNRDKLNLSNFSAVRGTRGYMAPEWVYSLPITSKVDVYSYGVVILELITGKSPTGSHAIDVEGQDEDWLLVTWVREKMNAMTSTLESRIEEIMDSRVDAQYDMIKMENLIRTALLCVEEEKDARPTMSQVVQMLMSHKKDQ